MNAPLLIGVAGRISAGKDTFAEILVRYYGYKHIAFSDPLYPMLEILNPMIAVDRKFLSALTPDEISEVYQVTHALCVRFKTLLGILGWDRIKRTSSEVRRYLQLLGTECGRNVHGQDCWLRVAERTMDENPGKYVITGLRFDNEMKFVKKRNGQLWIIKSTREVPADPNHVSESIKDYDAYADAILRNDGTQEEFVETVKTAFDTFYLD